MNGWTNFCSKKRKKKKKRSENSEIGMCIPGKLTYDKRGTLKQWGKVDCLKYVLGKLVHYPDKKKNPYCWAAPHRLSSLVVA